MTKERQTDVIIGFVFFALAHPIAKHKEEVLAMTLAPEAGTSVRLHAESHLTPLAKSLSEVFALNTTLLQQLAAELSSGRIALQHRAVEFGAYVGPSVDQVRLIKSLADGADAITAKLAKRELRDILAYHQSIRVEPLLAFLMQFPPKWRVLLMGALREDVCSLEFKVDGGSVVELIHLSDSARYEYALRGFRLTFKQMIDIAQWMRNNPDLLVLHDDNTHLDSLVELGSAEGVRMAALITLLDYFPEGWRALLASKVRPEVTHVGFTTTALGEVLMEVRYCKS